MHSVTTTPATNNFNHLIIDLLSEDDSASLRNSKKGVWSKPNVTKTYPITKTVSKCNTDENLFIDNGRRSRERVTMKNLPNEMKLSKSNVTNRKISKSPLTQQRVSRIHFNNVQRNSQISMTTDSMASMIQMAINTKCKPLIENLGNQLKVVDEKTKKSVLNKLELNERLIIIKSMFSGNNIKTKNPQTKTRPKSVNQRLSSSLSRIEDNSALQRKTIRKSFSFLQKEIPPIEISNLMTKEKEPSNQIDNSSKILIKQIEELQNQNFQLSRTIRDLISKNFILEKKLENLGQNELEITEMKSKMDILTQYHDNIIDNVYNAYRQLTRSLKQFKFSQIRSLSTTNLCFKNNNDSQNNNHYFIDRKLRSHSMDTFRRHDNSAFSKCEIPIPNFQIRKHGSDVRINEFIKNRKLSLENELGVVNENIEKINKKMIDDPINSAIEKKHLLEKKFLEQHQTTLDKMLKSIT